MQPRLGAISADGHVAPASTAIAALVDKQPFAVRADFQPLGFGLADELQRRSRGGQIERAGAGVIAMMAQRLGDRLEQLCQNRRIVTTVQHTMAKGLVDAFPQFHEPAEALRCDRAERWKILPLATKPAGGPDKGIQLRRYGKTVHARLSIQTQDDAVGDIERQGTAGKTVRGPGKGHAKL